MYFYSFVRGKECTFQSLGQKTDPPISKESYSCDDRMINWLLAYQHRSSVASATGRTSHHNVCELTNHTYLS